ncbi:hypothetical protein F7734_51875 [Scytonema sp. UIC 10036]|uniref:hypothetical protein n=1 Tax=Scytonema sp. UIC 10036 TaxID=2304196 RepID=UPI0012DA8077|nr:hypothetical protein [Scytonema sp. UIC 10036]MUH00325.1 hypothetical protein [Scytonema sp. UIC 10036]
MTTLAQRKSPLTNHQRGMIAAVINLCEDFSIAANDIWTIYVHEETSVLWVHLYNGAQLPFDCDWFREELNNLRLQQRVQKADECKVIAVEGKRYTVLNTSNNNNYTVEPHRVFSNQRCTCMDCRKRNQVCKHQVAVKRYQLSLSETLAVR